MNHGPTLLQAQENGTNRPDQFDISTPPHSPGEHCASQNSPTCIERSRLAWDYTEAPRMHDHFWPSVAVMGCSRDWDPHSRSLWHADSSPWRVWMTEFKRRFTDQCGGERSAARLGLARDEDEPRGRCLRNSRSFYHHHHQKHGIDRGKFSWIGPRRSLLILFPGHC
jgi:hypothetical protein